MKNGAFRKLSGKRGASVLIALLIFFLAALSGTIVLTMATSNAGRYTHEKEDQQSYLSVISAANLILSKLEGIEVYFESTEKESPQNDENNDKIKMEYLSTSDHKTEVEGTMFLGDKNFQDNLKTFSRGGDEGAQGIPFTLSTPSNNHEEIGVVHVSLMTRGSDLFFELYGEKKDYLLTLKVKTSFDYLKNGSPSNYTVNAEGYFYRIMIFDTANATYTVGKFIEKTEKGEEKTEGEGGAGE